MEAAIMPEKTRIGLKNVRALGPNEMLWDEVVTGFGARRQKGPGVTYFVYYRTRDSRQRWYTIGRHGSPYTPDTARLEALKILGEVAKGTDPASDKLATKKALTVAELADAYLADAETGRLLTRRRSPKKPSTIVSDRGRIERHIKPLLGRLKVTAVDRDDIEDFMHAVATGKTAGRVRTRKYGLARVTGGRGTATRTVGLLGGIFAYAVKKRLRADNPVRGVERFADRRRNRRLSDEEYQMLGHALRRAEDEGLWPAAIAVVRFLALTGWRSGEVVNLQWSEVDLARRTATLGDTKTGRSMRPLSHAACEVLKRLPPMAAQGPFPAIRGGRLQLPKSWERIAKLGGLLGDVTPHVLRHSFASLAGDLGYSDPTIGALIGHKGHTMTSRYVHSADAVLLAAADAIATETMRRMGETRDTVLPLRATAG
jgi:integrase